MATVTVIPPSIGQKAGVILRVAAYCRVSSGSEEQLNSYQSQMAYYSRKFECSETERLVDIYADEGITGTRDDKRLEFQRMIADCRKGKIDRIYTKSISRFARNTKDCLEYLRELKTLGITVFFEKENIDTAKVSDEMMITILGGLAQEESHSISENIKRAVRRKMANGTIKQLAAPYGYDLLDGQLVVNPEQAEVVRGIFRMYLSGMGYAAIARHLNIDGKRKSEKYDLWTIEAIAYILKNERYIGDSLGQKKSNEGLPFKKYRNYGKYPQFYISGTHEAIIDRESFEMAQALYQKRQHSPSTLQASPLTMQLYCSHCGTVYSRKRRNDAVIWTCRKHDAEAASCPSLNLCEGTITATFILMHNKLFMHRAEIIEPMLQMLAAVHQRGCHNDSAIKLHQELAKLREQTHVIAKLRTKGFLSEVKYQEQLAELNRKISKQQKQLHLLTQNDEEDEVLRELEQLEDYFENREQQMIAFEPNTFEMLVDKIIVHDRDALEFHLIGGLKLTEPLVTE